MDPVLAGVFAVHLLFAGLWTGSVLFVTYAVLPTAYDGDAEPGPLLRMTDKLTTISRASALLLLLTGGHLAAARYGFGALLESLRGNLVVAMVVLWFALAGLVEVGASRLRDGFEAEKVRTPARNARSFFLAASVVAILLLIDAGLLLGL